MSSNLRFVNERKKLTNKYVVKFLENERLGQQGNVDEVNHCIVFNKTRTRVLVQKKIESNTEVGMQKLLKYKEVSAYASEDEKILAKLVNNPAWRGLLQYFGSYRLLPFDILHTLCHEVRHVAQKEFSEQLLNTNNLDILKRDVYLAFVMIFQFCYQKLYDENDLGDYVRENLYFPIEIDAEYFGGVWFDELTGGSVNKETVSEWKKFNNRFDGTQSFEDFLEKIWGDFNKLTKRFSNRSENLDEKITLIKQNSSTVKQMYKKIFNYYNL